MPVSMPRRRTYGGERLARRVAGSRAEATSRAVDLHCARPVRNEAVGHTEREVLVAVEADLGVVAELRNQRADAIRDLVEDERTGRVHDIDALTASVRHDAGLRRQRLGLACVGHHEEAHRLQSELACQTEVLYRDVGLGAMGRDANDRDARVGEVLDVVLRADSRQHQRGDLRSGGGLDGGLHEQAFVGEREPVVVRRPAEAVAVSDLDDGHAGGVESGDDVADIVDSEPVPFCVRSVAKARVGDPDVERGGVLTRSVRCSASHHSASSTR